MSLVSSITSDGYSVTNFASVKSRSVKSAIPEVTEAEVIDDNPDESLPELASQNQFACPEEGCIKSFQRYSSLLKHLDHGNHKRTLECETLYDRAILGYASRLQHGASAVSEMRESCQISLSYASSVPMECALKCPRTRSTRFSTKQKEYLSAKFQIREQCGKRQILQLFQRLCT